MNAQNLFGVSTRVVMWIAGAQDVRIDVAAAGTDSARLTVSWNVAQISFTAADQVAHLAGEFRAMTGVSAVLPAQVHPRSIHGNPDQVGPLPIALVTFDRPRPVTVIPGKTTRDGAVVARWMDVTTGYLSLRVVDKQGWGSLTTALNRAETIAEAALPARSAERRTPVH